MQKITTTSSCQAVLVAVFKSLQQSIFLSYFLTSHGYPLLPVETSQDNMSTILLIENGRPTSELTRHIEIGYFWVKDLIERRVIEIIYYPFLFDSLKGKIMGTSLLYHINK